MTTLYATEIEYSPQNKDTSTVIVALGLNVTVGQKEDRENDYDDIPSGENQAGTSRSVSSRRERREKTYVNVSATAPIFSGAYHAENATMAGI